MEGSVLNGIGTHLGALTPGMRLTTGTTSSAISTMAEPKRGLLVGRFVVVGLAAVLIAACVVGAMAYRVAYGTFVFWADPPRISWCDRDYLLSPNTVLTQSAVEQQRVALGGDEPYSLVQVATVPPVVGQPAFAFVTPEATRDRLNVPCAMVLYLQTGPDSYRPYELSGGP